MKRTDISTAQARALAEKIGPMVQYLNRCRKRLDALAFDTECRLYKHTTAARDALRDLGVELHHQSIKSGVGRPDKERAAPRCHPPFPSPR
jgi:hypothetical protein